MFENGCVGGGGGGGGGGGNPPLGKYEPVCNKTNNSILTLCMLVNFSYFSCRLLTFFKINFFKKLFHKHYQIVKPFGSISGPDLGPTCLQWLSADDISSGSTLFAKFKHSCTPDRFSGFFTCGQQSISRLPV